MISVFIGEILQGWDADPSDARIYLIRDDKLVFFVGVVEGAILDHVLRHCGLVYNGPPADKVGRLLLDNAPSSNGWRADLLSLEDCEPVVRLIMPMYKRVDAERALYCLTTYYRPCLVEKDNPDPVPLPERYKKR
jgi:hypothetical protein